VYEILQIYRVVPQENDFWMTNLLVERAMVLDEITLSLEMPVPSQGHYGLHSFPVVD
jgi:hypothetical protein